MCSCAALVTVHCAIGRICLPRTHFDTVVCVAPPVVKDLRPALQPRVPVNDPRQEVDLARCQPYAVSPQVPTFQIELSICPRHDVPMHKLAFETSLNSFSVAQSSKTQSLTFPFLSYLAEGKRCALWLPKYSTAVSSLFDQLSRGRHPMVYST